MERLTERVNDRLIMMKQDSGDNVPYYWDEGNFKVAEKLADYEDAEEQGLLVRLPVSIGAKVYMIASLFDCVYNYDNCKATQKWKCEEDIRCEYERKSYYVKEIEFISIMKDSIGKSIFLTREEAEKKLEEKDVQQMPEVRKETDRPGEY